MSETTKATEQIDSLIRGLDAADAGRRVGWARAYAAESSKDELSRDVNMLRMERDIMRSAASFLLGFFRVYLERRGDTAAARTALTRWTENADRVLDPEVVAAGREAADKVIEIEPRLAAEREARAAEKKRRQAQNTRQFKEARGQERKLLMKRYGFANEAAFLNYLEQYRP